MTPAPLAAIRAALKQVPCQRCGMPRQEHYDYSFLSTPSPSSARRSACANFIDDYPVLAALVHSWIKPVEEALIQAYDDLDHFAGDAAVGMRVNRKALAALPWRRTKGETR